MIYSIHKMRRSQAGASAVEFALVMPVFLLMVFGTIELGRLFWSSHALQETAIATARCIGIPQLECEEAGVYSQSKAIAFAENKSAGWLVNLDSSSISIDHNATCYGVDGFSQVKIHYQFTTVVPKLLTSLAGGTDLFAEACFTNH